MLYAGPREAVLHAVFRQNMGATHFIIGRDHAGVGDYYGVFDAQTIFDEEVPPGALEIEIFRADHTAYSKKLNKVVMMRDAPDHTKDDFVLLSGTKVREMLGQGPAPGVLPPRGGQDPHGLLPEPEIASDPLTLRARRARSGLFCPQSPARDRRPWLRPHAAGTRRNHTLYCSMRAGIPATSKTILILARGSTMKDHTVIDRRGFVRRAGGLIAGGLLGGLALETRAYERGFTMSSTTAGRCISCRYWGGIRRISEDGKTITAESLGWCNNPLSKSFQKTTPPDFGPMRYWKQWDALG